MARSVSNEPLKVLGAGVLGFLVPLIVGVLLFVTVIGIPLGFVVLMTLGLAAFIGFVAMGVWLGDMLLRRGRGPADGRPIGSALLGLFLLLILGIIPLVSFFVGWFALGTVTLSFWRALTGGGDRYLPPGGMQPDPAWPGQQPAWDATRTSRAGRHNRAGDSNRQPDRRRAGVSNRQPDRRRAGVSNRHRDHPRPRTGSSTRGRGP